MIVLKKYKKFSNRKLFLIFLMFALAILSSFDFIGVSANNDDSGFSGNLFSTTSELLENIDFSELQSLLDEIDEYNLFENFTIKEKITNILNGSDTTNYSNIFSAVLSSIFSNVKNIIPIIFTIVGIGLVCSLVLNFQTQDKKSDVIYFVCFSLVVTVILVAFKNILNVTSDTLKNIENQMIIVFPILITLLSSIGALSSVSIYNPLVSILTGGVTFIFTKFLFPLFILIFLFTILNNLTTSTKLDKFIDLFNSIFKWTIGTIFTLFISFLSIQGISAGKFDSVSIKATKFAVKSYIPIIGSYISEGMDFIVLGSVLLKNSFGLIGVFVLFITILSPVINILMFKLGLQLSSAIVEMSDNSKISNFVSGCSKLLILPIAILLGVALMYIITICLIMCTANIF